jgi:hypothetical protein
VMCGEIRCLFFANMASPASTDGAHVRLWVVVRQAGRVQFPGEA